MKNKLLTTLIASTALTVSGYANAFTFNLLDESTLFGISFDGGGTGSSDFATFNQISYAGKSIVDITDVDTDGKIDNKDTFRDYGSMSSSTGLTPSGAIDFSSDLGGASKDYRLTATFSDWEGEFTNPEGDTLLTYDFFSGNTTWSIETTERSIVGGSIVESFTTTPVLVASIVEGSGTLNTTDGNGTMDILMAITTVFIPNAFYIDFDRSGTIEEDEDVFDVLTGAVDPVAVGAIDADGNPLHFGLASPNTDILDPNSGALGGVAEVNSATGSSFDVSDAIDGVDIASDDEFFAVGNEGQFLIKSIPEPGMLSIMGLAFLGLAGLQRRRRKYS